MYCNTCHTILVTTISCKGQQPSTRTFIHLLHSRSRGAAGGVTYAFQLRGAATRPLPAMARPLAAIPAGRRPLGGIPAGGLALAAIPAGGRPLGGGQSRRSRRRGSRLRLRWRGRCSSRRTARAARGSPTVFGACGGGSRVVPFENIRMILL